MKKFALIPLFFLSLSCLHAKKLVNFWTPEQNWSVRFQFNIEDSSDYLTIMAFPDFSCSLDMKEFRFNAGFRLFSNIFDFSSEFVYWPTFFRVLNVGVGSIFHINCVPKNFIETDFLIGGYLKYQPAKWFYVSLNFLYMLKNSHIYISDSETFRLKNNDKAFDLNFSFFPISPLHIYFNFSSYTQYKYMLYASPVFALGVSYRFPQKISVGLSADVQYIDFFTLSANLACVNFKAFVDFRI